MKPLPHSRALALLVLLAIVATVTGCRTAIAVSFTKPAIAVSINPKDYDGNSLKGELEATFKAPGSL